MEELAPQQEPPNGQTVTFLLDGQPGYFFEPIGIGGPYLFLHTSAFDVPVTWGAVPIPTPEPAAWMLLGLGIFGLLIMKWVKP